MKFGCSSRFTEAETVKRAGYDYVVFRGKEVAAAEDPAFESLVLRLGSLGLPCVSLNAYCSDDLSVAGPGYDREKTLSYALLLAPRAARLGVRTIGVGSPAARCIPADFDRKTAEAQFAEFLSDTAAVFGQYGIGISIEPLGYCYCNLVNRVDEALVLADTIVPPMDLTIDFYNMEQSGEADLDLGPYAGRIAHVHVSDDRGGCYQRSPLLPEKAPVHQARMKYLRDCGYDGIVTLEIDVPLVSEEIADTLQMLKRSIQ